MQISKFKQGWMPVLICEYVPAAVANMQQQQSKKNKSYRSAGNDEQHLKERERKRECRSYSNQYSVFDSSDDHSTWKAAKTNLI
jgi:hypothetical protein